LVCIHLEGLCTRNFRFQIQVDTAIQDGVAPAADGTGPEADGTGPEANGTGPEADGTEVTAAEA